MIANVLSVPLMGLVIIPAAVLAALLAPVGGGWIGLNLMKHPILWILSVAEEVSGWSGSLSFVPAPSGLVLPTLSLGLLWIVLWQGRGRLFGAPLAVLALLLWSQAERPLLLVSQSGGLLGAMTAEGRALSKPKGEGFAAESWLENDGDPALQSEAYARSAFQNDGKARVFWLGDERILHATGKTAAADVIERCQSAAIVIVNVVAKAPEGCRVFDAKALRATGALAISPGEAGPNVVSARELSGDRLWSP